MGSSSSKFRKHLQNGDEVAALNVYNSHSDLRKALDPNCSYGDNFQHETPLHFAARHGMKSLLRIFLHEKGGNPNKTNGRKETSLHCTCMEKNAQFYPVHRRRMECLQLLLKWRGAVLKDGEVEKVDLAAIDEQDNTALHYAAASGLKSSVELLVSHNAPLFMENKSNQTPCDCAESFHHSEIALYLESKMVFSNDTSTEEIGDFPPDIDSEMYSGLRAQDLQEAKDQLLVETADMLSIPLFTAEALLRNHEWSREMLLEAWMTDPLACCDKCGVTPPSNLFSEKPIVAESLSTPTLTDLPSPFADCDICAETFPVSEEPVHMACHQFCRECWEGYLNVKIQEGYVHHITCPGYECSILVPVEVIENVVSRDMARRYLQFDIKAFVESNPNINWCPFPGCGRAVKFPEFESTTSLVTSPRHSKVPSDTSRAVDCGNGHYFCWECLGEAHEPCSCESLTRWQGEINQIRPDQLEGTDSESEMASNCLWLVTNSKPCPNCKSPIQKNEGCNHMKCSKCKYDFCWVCLDQWKRHNSSTGGYFKCNRYEVAKKVDDLSKSAVKCAEENNTKMLELNKFVHYYTRYKNHENSYKLEEPLLKTAKEKMLKLAEAVTDLATAKDETKFVEEAIHQLLKARRMLKCSYVYGYYLEGPPYRKIVFEFMQTELEECTEILSQMVNRLYLRTPRKKIIEQSQIVQRKRNEFSTAISKGLVPPETPPGTHKRRRKYSMDTEDEDLRKAILASIEEFDPSDPWIIGASGRHTNVIALLDWPSDDDDDDDFDPSEVAKHVAEPPTPWKCRCCARARAKNPRTDEFHDFCSLRCSRIFKQQQQEEKQETVPEGVLDEQMDLLRALEMSRIQYMKEQGVVRDDDERSDLTSSGETSDPRSQGHISQRHTGHHHDNCTPVERLDRELKHMLELSALSADEEDSKKAVEACYLESQSGDERAGQTSRFGENQSTIVSRVPNKSVEDLYHADCVSCQGTQGLSPLTPASLGGSSPTHLSSAARFNYEAEDLDNIGACGGLGIQSGDLDMFPTIPKASSGSDLYPKKSDCDAVEYHSDRDISAMVDDLHIEGKMLQKMLNMDKLDMTYHEIFPSQGSSFGVIKDISVSNIHIDDGDKTKEFLQKDLSNLSKPKQVSTRAKGSGRLFAANTPGEDDGVFSLVSPESDFSESSSSEVWGYRPQYVKEQGAEAGMTQEARQQTPETDSGSDSNPYADHQVHNLVGDSPLETKSMNVNIGAASDEVGISIVEMTENLVQMTSEMQAQLQEGTSAYDVNEHRKLISENACDLNSSDSDGNVASNTAQTSIQPVVEKVEDCQMERTSETMFTRADRSYSPLDAESNFEEQCQMFDLDKENDTHDSENSELVGHDSEVLQYLSGDDKSTYV